MLTGRAARCQRCAAPPLLTLLSLLLPLLLTASALTAEPELPGAVVPINVTIRDSTPHAVCLTWALSVRSSGHVSPVDLQIIYRPVNASYRVVADFGGHRRSATLLNLSPQTQYRLIVTASHNGSLLGTSAVVFFHTPPTVPAGILADPYDPRNEVLSAEEIGIIVIVLGVWMLAIVLFFNRWGKIRMLEPYEYNFKYHHPLPDRAHRPSCPLAETMLQTSMERHCSLDRRLLPYGRRCSSLSAYLAPGLPRASIARNNSDPAAPPQPSPLDPPLSAPFCIHRGSLLELRKQLGSTYAMASASCLVERERQTRHLHQGSVQELRKQLGPAGEMGRPRCFTKADCAKELMWQGSEKGTRERPTYLLLGCDDVYARSKTPSPELIRDSQV